MAVKNLTLADKYLMALRIIQPARVQDISSAIADIWRVRARKSLYEDVLSLHKRFRDEGLLVPVRRGTYILSPKGLAAVKKGFKERDLDNARMFLMKQQRKEYHERARWHG